MQFVHATLRLGLKCIAICVQFNSVTKVTIQYHDAPSNTPVHLTHQTKNINLLHVNLFTSYRSMT